MFLQIPRALWIAVPLLFFLYLFDLAGTGLLGPDEPRYASIAREMARSGDWITPRLWGEPWFEKPPLLFWMTGAAFRLRLGEDLAPRLPVALLSIAFLIFYWWIVSRRAGFRAASYSAAILGVSAGWLGYSHVGATDLPMAAAFSAAMLLALQWMETGERRWLAPAAACLGLAVLAKGLVPLVLAFPLFWFARRKWKELLSPQVIGAFLVVAAPWYVLCYFRNGPSFVQKFFWEHHFGRFSSDALQHGQPLWFYIPVTLAAVFPWTPLLLLLFRKRLYSDSGRVFLLVWILFGLLFFSASQNKLPGYVLPLLPAAAALMGMALAESKNARWLLGCCAALLVLVPAISRMLPQALAFGLSRSQLPSLHSSWLPAMLGAALVWYLEGSGRRLAAFSLLSIFITASIMFLKIEALPAIDRTASARPVWNQIAGRREQVCVDPINRSWRYGLNYYSVTPLPDCDEIPKPFRIRQGAGSPPYLDAPQYNLLDRQRPHGVISPFTWSYHKPTLPLWQ